MTADPVSAERAKPPTLEQRIDKIERILQGEGTGQGLHFLCERAAGAAIETQREMGLFAQLYQNDREWLLKQAEAWQPIAARVLRAHAVLTLLCVVATLSALVKACL